MTERGIVSDGTHATTVLGLSDQYVYETVGSAIELALYSNVIDEMEDTDPLTTTHPDFSDWQGDTGDLSNGSNISDRSLRFSGSSGGSTVKTDTGGSISPSPSKIRAYFYIHQIGSDQAVLEPYGDVDGTFPFSMTLQTNNDIDLFVDEGVQTLTGSWASDTLYRVDFTQITWGSSGTNVQMEVINEDTDSSLGSATGSFVNSVDALEQIDLQVDADTVDLEWYGFSYE